MPMGSSRQEYGSGLPCPPPGDLPNPGVEPMSLMSPALADRFFTTGATWEALLIFLVPPDSYLLFNFFKFYLFTRLFLAMLGGSYLLCTGFSLIVASGGYSLVAVSGLLILVASLVVEPWL